MISSSIVASCSKKIHQQIFLSRSSRHSIFATRPNPTIPPSRRQISTSVSPPEIQNLSRLNHKDWLAPNEVLKIIKTLRNPNSVTTVLDLYEKRKDYRPCEDLYSLVINKFAHAKMFDAIEEIMGRIKMRRDCRLSDEFFYGVIKIYGHEAGRIRKGIETLFDMPSYNCWPSVKTFNFVLNLVVSAKVFDVVHEVYLGASKLGVEIDVCSLNILVKGLCESGNVDDALKLLDEFPKQKCKPNVRTFSTLMHGLCERKRVDDAFGLFERMEREGVFPDTITFNILISGLRKEGRVDEGMKLLEKMKHNGCSPNWGSYQEVLYALLDSKKFVEANEFMAQMILKGVSPSFRSYRLIIHGLCKNNLVDNVDWVLRQMILQGFIPKMGMWRKIIYCLFIGNRSNDSISFEAIIQN